MDTPFRLDIPKGTIIPPEKGWEESCWYVVEVAFSSSNVIHNSLFYTGFLDGNEPGGYNQFVSANTPGGGDHVPFRRAYYMKALKRLFTTKEIERVKYSPKTL